MHRGWAWCCAATLLLSVTARAQTVQISRGNDLLMRQGLQIWGFMFAELNGGFNQQVFAQSNFNGMLLGATSDYHPENYGAPGQYNWGITGEAAATQIHTSALPYFSTLKSWCYLDEQDISNPQVVQATGNWFNQMRADPRVQNVMFYANQFGEQFPEQTVRSYMQAAKPDALSFDYYIWGTQHPWLISNGSPTGLYKPLARYRRLSLEGIDGTGTKPIPFGKWAQTFISTRDLGPGSQALGYRMSESELRLDQFSGWAFGAKWTTAFTYDSASMLDTRVGPLLFDGDGPKAQPTPEFFLEAETNRQSRNIGPALMRLYSTDVQMLKGPNSVHDNGVDDFNGNADPFLKSVTAVNNGTFNGGTEGDVVLGWFRPLKPQAGTGSNDGRYFMIVNGLTWTGASAAATAQTIHLDFDFAGTGITSLQRISRLTGEIEIVPLIHDSGSHYHIDLTLPGGTGDLFKYNTGALFVPEEYAKWLAPVNGNWTETSRWSGQQIPDNPFEGARYRVVVDQPAAVGGVYSIQSASSRTIEGLAVTAAGARIQFTQDATLTIGAAGLQVLAGAGVNTPHLQLNGDATIDGGTFAGNMSLGAGRQLIVRNNGSASLSGDGATSLLPDVQITSGGRIGVVPGTNAVLRMNSLSIQGSNSRLDLADGRAIIDYSASQGSPLLTIRGYLAAGYANGAWTGQDGINSSIAAAAPANTLAVGYAEAAVVFDAFPATFAGEQIDDTSVVMRLTRYGDANLDGVVNLPDFNRFASHFGSAGATWSDGDFTYDGFVNLSDFNKLAANFGLVALASEPTPQDWANLAAAVPEPASASFVLVLLCASAAASRRRPARLV